MAAATTVREGTLEEAAGGSETAAGLKERADHAESALRECSVRHGKTLVRFFLLRLSVNLPTLGTIYEM